MADINYFLADKNYFLADINSTKLVFFGRQKFDFWQNVKFVAKTFDTFCHKRVFFGRQKFEKIGDFGAKKAVFGVFWGVFDFLADKK